MDNIGQRKERACLDSPHLRARHIKAAQGGGAPSIITDNSDELLDNPEIDLIVEVIDDASASYGIVKKALERGKTVVSGNKAMLARHLPELIELQRRTGSALLYDASSCGSIPVIRNLEEYYDNDLLLEVKGILNGSSNYILACL